MRTWHKQRLTEYSMLHLYIHISQNCEQWKLYSGSFIERPVLSHEVHMYIFCPYKIVLRQFRLLQIQNIQKYKLLYWLAMLKYYILNHSITLSQTISSWTSWMPWSNANCNIIRTPCICTLCHFRREIKLLLAAGNVTELCYTFVHSKSLNFVPFLLITFRFLY